MIQELHLSAQGLKDVLLLQEAIALLLEEVCPDPLASIDALDLDGLRAGLGELIANNSLTARQVSLLCLAT